MRTSSLSAAAACKRRFRFDGSRRCPRALSTAMRHAVSAEPIAFCNAALASLAGFFCRARRADSARSHRRRPAWRLPWNRLFTADPLELPEQPDAGQRLDTGPEHRGDSLGTGGPVRLCAGRLAQNAIRSSLDWASPRHPRLRCPGPPRSAPAPAHKPHRVERPFVVSEVSRRGVPGSTRQDSASLPPGVHCCPGGVQRPIAQCA